MRAVRATALAVLAAALCAAPAVLPATSGQGSSGMAAATSGSFGAPGAPIFATYTIPDSMPDAHGAGEPSMGIAWGTDHTFVQAFAHTYRLAVDDNKTKDGMPEGTWTQVTPAFTVTNVDPMLHVDHVSGRVWAGGLDGACSIMGMSDDDGGSWLPAGNMCNFAQFDHQSIGSGAWAASPVPRGTVYPRATYYCSQGQVVDVAGLNYVGTSCLVSPNGGLTWSPPDEVLGGCAGLHGHIRVSEVTGTAAVPDGSCTDQSEGGNPVVGTGQEYIGFGFTSDNGVTWNSRIVPNAKTGDGFDPSLDFSKQSGWLWEAQANVDGVHVAMSKDEGKSWSTLGNGTPALNASKWLDLSSAYHDDKGNPIKYATFMDVLAGDDNRTALTFLATTQPGAKHPFDDCGSAGDGNIWFPFVAMTFDAGQTWTVTRMSDDPVQVGAIWNGGGGNPCRNLLDFGDADMDSHGRVEMVFADGCTGKCVTDTQAYLAGNGKAPSGSESRDALGTVLRQTAGRGLFAKYDTAGTPEPTPEPPASTTSTGRAPGVALPVVALAVAAVALLVRRRSL